MNLESFSSKSFQGVYLIEAVVVHAGAVASLFFFTWKALLFAFGSAALFAYSMGIFHHMLLTHWSFDCHPALRRVGGLLGTLTWRGPFSGPVRYAAIHKVHHAFSDTAADPHSPREGLFHAMMGWFWWHSSRFRDFESYAPMVKRVSQDPWLSWMDRRVLGLQVLWGVVCFVGGWVFGDLENGLRYLLFGVFVKTVIVLYAANAVDLINHTVGYRNFDTDDTSTNSLLMFALHLGGAISWHNNHHAHAGYFSVKSRWWEWDAHLLVLRFLSLFGWVSNIAVLDTVGGEKKVARLAPRSRQVTA